MYNQVNLMDKNGQSYCRNDAKLFPINPIRKVPCYNLPTRDNDTAGTSTATYSRNLVKRTTQNANKKSIVPLIDTLTKPSTSHDYNSRITNRFGRNISVEFGNLMPKNNESKINNNDKKTVADTTSEQSYENFNFRVFGSSTVEKIFTFTGSVERLIKWHKIFRNHFCFFEVIATVVSIQEGSVRLQKIMLIRDKKGPILQVTYYTSTHLDIEDFHFGQSLRCVGRMIGYNMLSAVSIRTATQEEVEKLHRYCCICDRAISHFLNLS